MSEEQLSGECWPTPTQELLLRAALWKGEEALEAWRAWQAGVDFEKLDQGSYRLIPLLYRNLRGHGVAESQLARYKGVYRQTWVKNQILLRSAAGLIAGFQHAGIPTLLLKGIALTLLHYRDKGLRPMWDLDVLVRAEQVPAAADLLQRKGWVSTSRNIRMPEPLIQLTHSAEFVNPAGQRLDLHWHVLLDSREPKAEVEFWSGAVPVQVNEASALALNPADALLHVCVHGARWSLVPPLRWVADAAAIINSSPELDWNRLIAQAKRRRLVLPMRDTLAYLNGKMHIPVPPETLDALASLATSEIERAEYVALLAPRREFGAMRALWYEYARLARENSWHNGWLGFARYLQYSWDLEYLWQVPFHALYRRVRKLRRAARSSIGFPPSWVSLVLRGPAKNAPSISRNSQLSRGPLASEGDPWKEERYTGN